MTNFAWVIEHGGSPVSGPLYWAGGNEWSADHMKAVRFSREQDATVVRNYQDYGVDHSHRVCEHGWIESIADSRAILEAGE